MVLTSTSCAVLHGTHVVAHVLEVLLSVHRDRSIVVVVIIVVVGTRTPVVVTVTEVVTSSTAHPAICHDSWTHLGEPVATIRTRRVLGRDIRVRMVVRIHCYGRSQLEADASCAFFLERERVRRRTRWSLLPALPLRLFRGRSVVRLHLSWVVSRVVCESLFPGYPGIGLGQVLRTILEIEREGRGFKLIAEIQFILWKQIEKCAPVALRILLRSPCKHVVSRRRGVL